MNPPLDPPRPPVDMTPCGRAGPRPHGLVNPVGVLHMTTGSTAGSGAAIGFPCQAKKCPPNRGRSRLMDSDLMDSGRHPGPAVLTSSPPRAHLHLVRHGRTASNQMKRCAGWSDERIEPTALTAAEATARYLADEPIAAIYTSPVIRAVETAQPLVEKTEVPLVSDERLGELHVGPWEGLTEAVIARRYPQEWAIWRSQPEQLALDGRETLHQLWNRVGEVMGQIAQSGPTVVVFTHDAVVRAGVAWALGAPVSAYRHIAVDNCSITTICVGGGRRTLVRLNDCCHLAGLDDDPAT